MAQILTHGWDLPPEDAARDVADTEVANRIANYPALAAAVLEEPVAFDRVREATSACWSLNERFFLTRFKTFGDDPGAGAAIAGLVREFPAADDAVAGRIDEFVARLQEMGFLTPTGGHDRFNPALVASVFLTAAFPDRFIDHKRGRWSKFGEVLGVETPAPGISRGAWIVWAGRFASSLAATPTFRSVWPRDDPRFAQPLWVLSGVCWWAGYDEAKRELPPAEPANPADLAFPEGARKRRLHLRLERSRSGGLVAAAKRAAAARDPRLPCEGCGISFRDVYGERGEGFIEAHHRIPIAKLTEETQHRVEDLAMVCSDCHCMLHRGERSLTVVELRALINA